MRTPIAQNNQEESILQEQRRNDMRNAGYDLADSCRPQNIHPAITNGTNNPMQVNTTNQLLMEEGDKINSKIIIQSPLTTG